MQIRYSVYYILFQDECLSPPQQTETHRRLSLAPPAASGTPIISLPSDDNLGPDKKRRPSAQSLGPFSFSVSLFGDSRRGSYQYSDSRRSSERLRRPSTHSVGILPIAMFGESAEKPRKPSTHSLGLFPMGWNGENELFPSYDGSPRRPSATSLGPFWSTVSARHDVLCRWLCPCSLWPFDLRICTQTSLHDVYALRISQFPFRKFSVVIVHSISMWITHYTKTGKSEYLSNMWHFKVRNQENKYRYTILVLSLKINTSRCGLRISQKILLNGVILFIKRRKK